MKRILPLLLLLASAVLAAAASAEDRPAAVSAEDQPVFSRERPAAAFRTSSPWGLSAFAAWDRLARELEKPGAETLKADTWLLGLGFRPAGWFGIYAFGGASTAKFDHVPGSDPALGFAGGAGADLSLWQIDDGDFSPWCVRIGLSGRYLHRESDDDAFKTTCKLDEIRAVLPVTYALSFSERARMRYQEVFTGLEVAAGPAASWLSGTIEHEGGFEEDVEPKEKTGLFLSAALLFGDSWRLCAEGLLIKDFSGGVQVRYDF